MSSAPADDPHLAAALAKAERRQALLEELSDIGMNLARQIDAHAAAAMAAINEEHGGDPARPFATLSRAVRLTLAMEARVDAQILALRNGKVPAGWGAAAPAVRVEATSRAERSGEGPGALRENLTDWEDDEAVLDRPFAAGVGAILATPPPPAEAGEVAHDAKRHETEGARGPIPTNTRAPALRPLHHFVVPLPRRRSRDGGGATNALARLR